MRTTALVFASLALSPVAVAADGTEQVRAALAKHSPELAPQRLQVSPADGLFHVVLEGTSGYMTHDGRYFIAGDLIDIAARKNLTEEDRKADRLALLKSVRFEDEIVFAPAQPKHTVTVFTDVDCGFCRRLHGEIAKYGEAGIAVRYVAFPRSGHGSPSWTKMEDVWCAPDRAEQLTRAKRGEPVTKRATSCTSTPIEAQYRLGERIGVQGTPTMILEDGTLVGGYFAVEKIAAELERKQTAK